MYIVDVILLKICMFIFSELNDDHVAKSVITKMLLVKPENRIELAGVIDHLTPSEEPNEDNLSHSFPPFFSQKEADKFIKKNHGALAKKQLPKKEEKITLIKDLLQTKKKSG